MAIEKFVMAALMSGTAPCRINLTMADLAEAMEKTFPGAVTDLRDDLLRVLQENQFERLGDTKTMTVDVRVIAATNKSLEKAIAEKTFREDFFTGSMLFRLFCRLCVSDV